MLLLEQMLKHSLDVGVWTYLGNLEKEDNDFLGQFWDWQMSEMYFW